MNAVVDSGLLACLTLFIRSLLRAHVMLSTANPKDVLMYRVSSAHVVSFQVTATLAVYISIRPKSVKHTKK